MIDIGSVPDAVGRVHQSRVSQVLPESGPSRSHGACGLEVGPKPGALMAHSNSTGSAGEVPWIRGHGAEWS